MPIYPACSGEVKESLRSVYSHKADRISQIRNSISKSLNLLILKQDTPEPYEKSPVTRLVEIAARWPATSGIKNTPRHLVRPYKILLMAPRGRIQLWKDNRHTSPGTITQHCRACHISPRKWDYTPVFWEHTSFMAINSVVIFLLHCYIINDIFNRDYRLYRCTSLKADYWSEKYEMNA